MAKLRLVHIIIWFPLNIINYCPVRIVGFIPFIWTAGITNANSQWQFWSALFKIGFVQVERLLKLLQTFLKRIRFCLFCISYLPFYFWNFVNYLIVRFTLDQLLNLGLYYQISLSKVNIVLGCYVFEMNYRKLELVL